MFWINSAGVDYSHNMPQHKMVICLPKPQLTEEKAWLDEHIYGKEGASSLIPQSQITARTRYSHRAHSLEHS